LLPFNIDGLPNGGGTGSHLFLAGDVRANEQVGLTAIHTLFVREHNRLADRIKAVGYLNADDEMIYQLARKLVMAEVQIITYNEFLPALLGSRAPKLEDYHFQESVNPQLSNEFSTAFFRFGHTMLPRAIFLAPVSPDESTEWIELRRAFFNIRFFTEHPENIDRVLLGLTATEAEEIDCMIVEDVRSFLFSHDGIHTVCLDLAALNIQRGRDHQIPSYNEVRRALGLRVKTSFDQITANTVFQQSLEQVYGSVNKIDPWIGALAEDHLPDASVGELLTVAMAKQFEAFRDGDPLFFQRSDPIFNMPGMERILNLDDVNLGFVILANTRISDIDFTSCFIGQDAGLAPTAQPSDQRTHPPTTSPSIPPIPDPAPPPTPRDVRTIDPVGEPECRQWILSGEKRFSTRKSVS
jgi:peroxidase